MKILQTLHGLCYCLERETMTKKEMILEAASQCFARYGFDKTTLDDIGNQVGLNKASLYYYYKNKEMIYAAVIHRESEIFLNSARQKVDSLKGCRERIFVYLDDRLDHIHTLLNLYQLSKNTAIKIQPMFKELICGFREQEVELLTSILDCCQAKGELVCFDSTVVAGHLLTVANAIKHQDFEEHCVVEMKKEDFTRAKEKIKFVIDLILKGLKKE